MRSDARGWPGAHAPYKGRITIIFIRQIWFATRPVHTIGQTRSYGDIRGMSALHLITTRNADVAALRIWADDVDKIGDARLAPKIALPAHELFTASKGERWALGSSGCRKGRVFKKAGHERFSNDRLIR